ncbi:hypothetical protein [Tenacibaculum aiptasiae]|uniref:hypothetical protein n=1 Tax=Tenacibaculum aiptasiae TaxID=426481 RepID=UPI00232B9DE1|nr:hypothetical protein [Tenacibaculum aiptasiae]
MKNNLTKTQESILVLCSLQTLLDEYLKCLSKEKNNSNSVIFSVITSQIIITSCSYLEEWEYFARLIKEEQESRIIILRKITKPVIDRINEWKDLRKFRNNMIAHNHRIKKENNSLAIFNLSRSLYCPNSFYDYKLLSGCIFIANRVLLKLFAKEYKEILPQIKNIENITSMNEIKNERDYKKELYNLVESTQNLINEYKLKDVL